MKEIHPLIRITQLQSGGASAGAPDVLAEKFFELTHLYRKLELQTLRLKTDVEVVVRLIQSMEPGNDKVMVVAAKRLSEALQKFSFDDLSEHDSG